jgi:hypothetical protein
MTVESTLPRPKTIKRPAADKPPRVEQAPDPRDRDREAEIVDAIEQLERSRLDYIDDQCLPAAVWARAFAVVIVVDAGRVPPSCMPLLAHVEDLAKYLDDLLTNRPDINWNTEPIENALCAKLDALNQIVSKITAPPEPFSMVDFVRERLQERGRSDTSVTPQQIARMTGLPEAEIKAFRDDPESVDWTGRELPATLETEQAKRAAAAKFNSGRGLSTFASKFIACGFSASPSPEE